MLTKDVIAFCNKEIADTQAKIDAIQDHYQKELDEYNKKSWFDKLVSVVPVDDISWKCFYLERDLAFLNTTLKRAKYNQANDKNWMMVEDSAWFQKYFYNEYTE